MYKLGLFTLLATVVLVSGCATVPVEIEAPRAMIQNRATQAISVIRYQPCDSAQEEWADLENSRLQPGQGARFVLPEDCVNLVAYYESGKVAGKQTGVRRSFPLRWSLF
ncbi:hypothetical protein ACF3NA_02635 [Alkanindiges sp. WGS2144]|uniref:hypothetical protein n=1 Tax=Alkanindiges sp. WGS2144 TaxID=3366808 RepID=UPI003753BBEB